MSCFAVQFTRRTYFNFTDLLPYRKYEFNVFVQNQFTMLRFPGDRFDVDSRIFTTEGGLYVFSIVCMCCACDVYVTCM